MKIDANSQSQVLIKICQAILDLPSKHYQDIINRGTLPTLAAGIKIWNAKTQFYLAKALEKKLLETTSPSQMDELKELIADFIEDMVKIEMLKNGKIK